MSDQVSESQDVNGTSGPNTAQGDPRVILVHRLGNNSLTVERDTRFTQRPEWGFCIASDDPLMDGYDEAFIRLDDQSVKRLLHWLQTGEAPLRDADLPDLPEVWRRNP